MPSQWRNAHVVPVAKKADAVVVNEFRPISLTAIPSKICERWILLHMKELTSKVLPDRQYGFREGRGTVAALLDAEASMVASLEECTCRLRAAVVSFDVAKAFDSINHNILLQKLQGCQLPHCIVRWLWSFITQRTQSVKVGHSFSRVHGVPSGVPQGTVLSPILYNITTNDIKAVPVTPTAKMICYADDLLLIKPISTPQQEAELHRDVATIANYFSSQKLKLNASKTNLIILSYSKPSDNLRRPLMVNGVAVETTETLKYLGVHFDRHINMSLNASIMARRCRSMMGAVAPFLRRWRLRSALSKVWTTSVRPVLTHALSLTYGPLKRNQDSMENVNRFAARLVTNDYSTPYEGLLSAIEWPTIKQIAVSQQLSLMYDYTNGFRVPPFAWLSRDTKRRSSRLNHQQRLSIDAAVKWKRSRARKVALLRMAEAWNSLPCDMTMLGRRQFKLRLKRYHP